MKVIPVSKKYSSQDAEQVRSKSKKKNPVDQVYQQKKLSSSSSSNSLKRRAHKPSAEPLTFGKLLKFSLFAIGVIQGSKQNNLLPGANADQIIGTSAFNPYNRTFITPQNGNTAMLDNGHLLCVLSDREVLYRQRVVLFDTKFLRIGPTLNSIDLSSPQIAPLTASAYVVVGIDKNQLTAVQYYSATDLPVGSPFEIQYYGTTHYDPHVATLENGDIVVVFSRLFNNFHWLYFSHMRWSGMSWSAINTAEYQQGNAGKPNLFALSSGGYVLTGQFATAGHYRPMRYIYDGNDNLLVSDYIDTINSGYEQTQVKGTELANHTYVIAWLVSRTSTSSAISISYRMFDSSTNDPIGPESSIPLSIDSWDPQDWVLDLAANSKGFVITATANLSGVSTDIVQEAFDFNGRSITDIDQAGNNLNGTRPFATKIGNSTRWLISWLGRSKEFFLRGFELAPNTTTPTTKGSSRSTTTPTTRRSTQSTATQPTKSSGQTTITRYPTRSWNIPMPSSSAVAGGISTAAVLGIIFGSLACVLTFVVGYIVWRKMRKKGEYIALNNFGETSEIQYTVKYVGRKPFGWFTPNPEKERDKRIKKDWEF